MYAVCIWLRLLTAQERGCADSLIQAFFTHAHSLRSGLSKLFSRPKAKEEGDEEDGHTNDEEATAEPHKSPRRQTTSPKGDKAEEREAEDRVSMTPEPLKKAPPPVRKKPVKSRSVDFGMEMGREEEGEEGGEGEKRRRPVGGVAAMPLPGLDPSKLTGVLKSRPSPQRRTKVSQLTFSLKVGPIFPLLRFLDMSECWFVYPSYLIHTKV